MCNTTLSIYAQFCVLKTSIVIKTHDYFRIKLYVETADLAWEVTCRISICLVFGIGMM